MLTTINNRLLYRTAARTTAAFRPLLIAPTTSSFSKRSFHATSPNMVVHKIETADAFKAALKDNKVVLLDCFATWCGPCKAIAPIVEKQSEDEAFKSIYFAQIDVDALPDVSQELGIRAMPTFILFKDGEKAESVVGANPKGIETLLQKHA